MLGRRYWFVGRFGTWLLLMWHAGRVDIHCKSIYNACLRAYQISQHLLNQLLISYGWYKLTVRFCDYSGAATTNFTNYSSLTEIEARSLPNRCVSIYCQGYETSLAECVIYDKISVGRRKLATVTCYEEFQAPKGSINYQLFLKLLLFYVMKLCPDCYVSLLQMDYISAVSSPESEIKLSRFLLSV